MRPLLALLICLLPALSLAAETERPDLARAFAAQGLDGCFVLRQGADVVRVNAARARTPFRPASTFKIPNALTALEAGIAPDTDFPLAWDGARYPDFPAWERDQTLESAFRASCVWYFVELGRRNGRERLAATLAALDYGNRDVSGSDAFWLDGALRISADGQADYLERLGRGRTAISPRSLALLRRIMLLESGPGPEGEWRLYAKTGMALRGGGPAPYGEAPVGWIVGFVERGGRITSFALNASPLPGDARGAAILVPARLQIARELLTALGALPPRP